MSSFRPIFAVSLLLAAAAPRSGCVVRYGPPVEPAVRAAEPLPPPADFDEVVARVDDLLADPVDVDQRDRLLAATTLARRARTDDAATQRVVLAYLREVVEIEERSRPVEAPVLEALPSVDDFTPLATPEVVEEALDDAAAAQSADLAERLAAALACRNEPCWAAHAAAWPALRDAHVTAVREEAGRRYLAAREQADPADRLAGYRAVRALLADLADRFPDAEAADDVRRNVALVQREIESALAAEVEAPQPVSEPEPEPAAEPVPEPDDAGAPSP